MRHLVRITRSFRCWQRNRNLTNQGMYYMQFVMHLLVLTVLPAFWNIFPHKRLTMYLWKGTSWPIATIYIKSQSTFIYIHIPKHIFIYMLWDLIYMVYVWKLNQAVLELYFRAVKSVFFPRRDLNSHHWYTAAPFA
jgi:hypothetical protein